MANGGHLRLCFWAVAAPRGTRRGRGACPSCFLRAAGRQRVTGRALLRNRSGLGPSAAARLLQAGPRSPRRERSASKPLGPQVMTLFGDRVFADVVKLRRGHAGEDGPFNLPCVLGRDGRVETRRRTVSAPRGQRPPNAAVAGSQGRAVGNRPPSRGTKHSWPLESGDSWP